MAIAFTQFVTKPISAVQVTAANRSELATLVGGTIEEGILQVPDMFGSTYVPTPDGSFVIRAPEPATGFNVWDGDSFGSSYVQATDGPGMVGTTGRAVSPSTTLAGATVDVTVPLKRRMPSAEYTPVASVIGGAGTVLTGARVVGIVSWTDAAVVVRVQNTGLSAIASGGFTVAVLAAV